MSDHSTDSKRDKGPGATDRRSVALPAPDRDPAGNARLALLLEVAGTPKPGNVDRDRDLDDLGFEHFLAGAVGAGAGLDRAQRGASVGVAFERAVAGMSRQKGGNTQFGCLLLLVPLVRAAADDGITLSPAGLREVVSGTTVADAVDFYRAFEHVDVAVGDPPPDADELDVRRGSDAAGVLRRQGATLADVMTLSATAGEEIADGNAREWVEGFPRSFRVADRLLADDGPVADRAARAFLDELAREPDSLVATKHTPAVAREISRRTAEVGNDPEAAEDLAESFHEEGINPGTTADIVCGGLFVALERGLEV